MLIQDFIIIPKKVQVKREKTKKKKVKSPNLQLCGTERTLEERREGNFFFIFLSFSSKIQSNFFKHKTLFFFFVSLKKGKLV